MMASLDLALRVRFGKSKPVYWTGKCLNLALKRVGGPLDFRFRLRVRFREIFGNFDHQNFGLNKSKMLKKRPDKTSIVFLIGPLTSGTC